MRKYRVAHREQIREYARKWYKAHPEACLAKSRKRWQNSTEKERARTREWLYGITDDDYRQLLIEQKGVCAICGSNRTKKGLTIDHDHATGIIRGLLCGKCNLGLGHFDDDSSLLRKAANFLDNSQEGKE
jgi:hypothetical protein